MEIKFLKAGTGDSILIHHEKHNILVDGGNDSRYLLNEIDAIYKNNEVIDLLIITHHDDDHIRGIIDLLELIVKGNYGEPKKFIKKVIFNSPRLILEKLPAKKNKSLSYKQAHLVEELLMNISPNWEKCTDESDSIEFAGLKIDILSPNDSSIEKYSEHKNVYLTSDYRCDWNTPMYILEKHLTDESQDKSIPNMSSVVLKLECDDKKVLLTADVTPDRLEFILNKLVEDNEGIPLSFDYVKLPHHASYRSLNKKIIENIRCDNYIISTNSKKYFLPNKRALLKIVKNKNKEQINFLFNYEEAIDNLNITSKEMKDYNFKLTPNNKDYGISI